MGQMQNGAVCAEEVVATWAPRVTIHWPFPVLRDFDSSEQPAMWLRGTSRSEFGAIPTTILNVALRASLVF